MLPSDVAYLCSPIQVWHASRARSDFVADSNGSAATGGLDFGDFDCAAGGNGGSDCARADTLEYGRRFEFPGDSVHRAPDSIGEWETRNSN
jgi:hypothetical protein